jgi:hypothetical protein
VSRAHKIWLSLGIVLALAFARAPWVTADSIPPTTWLDGTGTKIGSTLRLRFPVGWTGSLSSGLVTLVAPGGAGGSVVGSGAVTVSTNDGGVATVGMTPAGTMPVGELYPDPRYRSVKIYGDYTATSGDFIEATCGAGDGGLAIACTVTLPSAAVVGSSTTTGVVAIKDIGCTAATGPILVKTMGMDLSTQSIDGVATWTLNTSCGGASFISDGYNWYTAHGGIYRRVQNAATVLPFEPQLQFDGTLLVATDDPTHYRTSVAISNVAANLGLFGPATGAAAAPTFRAIVSADLPINDTSITWSTIAEAAALAGQVAVTGSYTVGNEFCITRSASTLTGMRYQFPEAVSRTMRFRLYNSAGTLQNINAGNACNSSNTCVEGTYSTAGTKTVVFPVAIAAAAPSCWIISAWDISGTKCHQYVDNPAGWVRPKTNTLSQFGPNFAWYNTGLEHAGEAKPDTDGSATYANAMDPTWTTP